MFLEVALEGAYDLQSVVESFVESFNNADDVFSFEFALQGAHDLQSVFESFRKCDHGVIDLNDGINKFGDLVAE